MKREKHLLFRSDYVSLTGSHVKEKAARMTMSSINPFSKRPGGFIKNVHLDRQDFCRYFKTFFIPHRMQFNTCFMIFILFTIISHFFQYFSAVYNNDLKI